MLNAYRRQVLKHGDEWRVPFVGKRGWKEVLPFYTVTATM
jgi:hypothetical protein